MDVPLRSSQNGSNPILVNGFNLNQIPAQMMLSLMLPEFHRLTSITHLDGVATLRGVATWSAIGEYRRHGRRL